MLNKAKDLKIGTTDVQRVYLNNIIVWERTQPTPPVEGDYVYFFYDAAPMPDPAFEWRTTTAQERSQGYVEWGNCYLPMYEPERSLYIVRVKIVDNAFSSQGFELQTLIPDTITEIPSEKYRTNEIIKCVCGIASHPTTTLPPTNISVFGEQCFIGSALEWAVTKSPNVVINNDAFFSSFLTNIFDENVNYSNIYVGDRALCEFGSVGIKLPSNAMKAIVWIGEAGINDITPIFGDNAVISGATLNIASLGGVNAPDASLKVVVDTLPVNCFFWSTFDTLDVTVNGSLSTIPDGVFKNVKSNVLTINAIVNNSTTSVMKKVTENAEIDTLKLTGHLAFFRDIVQNVKYLRVIDLTELDAVPQMPFSFVPTKYIPDTIGIEEIRVPAELLDRYKSNWSKETFALTKLIGV